MNGESLQVSWKRKFGKTLNAFMGSGLSFETTDTADDNIGVIYVVGVEYFFSGLPNETGLVLPNNEEE